MTVQNTSDMPDWLSNYVKTYNGLSAGNLHLLSNIYTDNITFVDPLTKHEGLLELTEYFQHLYHNLTDCSFSVHDWIIDNNKTAIYWKMSMSHKKLNSGKAVTVEGHSKLVEVDGKVLFQQDYFDVGAMIYENVPVVGALVRLIKAKASE